MGLQAELVSSFKFHISLFGVTPAGTVAMIIGEGSEFESSTVAQHRLKVSVL